MTEKFGFERISVEISDVLRDDFGLANFSGVFGEVDILVAASV